MADIFDPTDPTDNSIVAQFPANERTFRGNVKTFLALEHDAGGAQAGRHAFSSGSTATRNTITNFIPGSLWFNTDWNTLQVCIVAGSPAQFSSTEPLGTVKVFAFPQSAALPDGFLDADGSAISRTTYSAYFALVGTTYGAGDGSTTFNLPDSRGRGWFGNDQATGRLAGSSLGSTIGSVGGAATTTLVTANLAAHNHVINISDPGHFHTTSNIFITGSSSSGLGGGSGILAGSPTTDTKTTGISATSNNTGTGTAFSTVSPGIVGRICIKVL